MRVFAQIVPGDVQNPEASREDVWSAVLYTEHRAPVAVIIGSWGYVADGLVAAGLTPPVGLPEHRDRGGVTLIGQQPPHRLAQSGR